MINIVIIMTVIPFLCVWKCVTKAHKMVSAELQIATYRNWKVSTDVILLVSFQIQQERALCLLIWFIMS